MVVVVVVVVVVGARGGAGVGRWLLPLAPGSCWGKLPLLGTAADANSWRASMQMSTVSSTNPVVALVAETCLDEAVEEGNVEDPEAKANAGRC